MKIKDLLSTGEAASVWQSFTLDISISDVQRILAEFTDLLGINRLFKPFLRIVITLSVRLRGKRCQCQWIQIKFRFPRHSCNQ